MNRSTWTEQTPGQMAQTALQELQWSVFPLDENKRPPAQCLPEIFLNQDQLREIVDQSLAAIQRYEQYDPRLFMQSSRLVYIGHTELHRPHIMQMSVVEVKELLSHAANFYRLKKVPGAKDKCEKSPASPPKEVAEQILARRAQEPYLPFPALMGIVETPVIRPDGSILDQPGYDAATQLYYAPLPGMETCQIPPQPTIQECQASLELLWSAMGEFPYVSKADKANTLALLLTPLLRPAIQRHIPLALIDAPQQGTGKGLLSDIVSIVASGKCASILTMPGSDEELQKVITALLVEGATTITIDNISGRLQSKHLDAVLTSDMWQGRLLGSSKMLEVPQRATWLATGNNIQLGGDLARRCYRIRLDAKVSRPFLRKGFTHPDLVNWAMQHRAELVKALLTLARAWYVEGKPQDENLPTLGTFSEWVNVIGGILKHAGVTNFLGSQEQIYEDLDEERDEWEAFVQAWHDKFQETWVPLTTIIYAIKANEVNGNDDEEAPPNALSAALPTPLQITYKEKPNTFILRLAKALSKKIDTCFGKENFRIEKMQDTHSRAQLWRVFSEVAEVAEVSSIHFQNEKIEENKIHSENDRNKPQQPPTSAKQQRQDMPVTLEGDEKPYADIPQGDLPQKKERVCFRFKPS